jgi:hypothetical protein
MAEDNTTTTVQSAPLKDVSKRVPADYTRKVDESHHTEEHVVGNETEFKTEQQTDSTAKGEFDNRLMTLVNGAVESREKAENVRANRRNRNRILILVFVLIMELAVPTLYGLHLLPLLFVKYEVLAITLPDALLTVYAYVRKY